MLSTTVPSLNGSLWWLSLLRLMRFPALFFAISDVLLGYACSASLSGQLNTENLLWHFSQPIFLLGLGCSASLYLAGMVLNDFFDRKQDARERPQRPIPSGSISPLFAGSFGGTLLLLGLFCGWFAGPRLGGLATLLTLLILLYSVGLKATLLGPGLMGACRGLNFFLGFCVPLISSTSSNTWFTQSTQVEKALFALLPITLFSLITGITWLARFETGSFSVKQIKPPCRLIFLASLGYGCSLILWSGTVPMLLRELALLFSESMWLGALHLFVLAVLTRLLPAILLWRYAHRRLLTCLNELVSLDTSLDPENFATSALYVQQAVRTLLGLCFLFQVAVLFPLSWQWGLSVLLLWWPAQKLGRFIRIS